jgi:NADH-quinone oxidoreductase subunit D
MDLLEMISGNRVHYAINTLGGVRRDLDEAQKAKILEGLRVLKARSEYYFKIGANEPTFVGRLAGVGKLTKQQAMDLCATGPVAKASGVARDIRKDDPHAFYDEVEFEVATADSCDVLGRTVVRIKELFESYKIAEFIIRNLPDGPIAVKAPRRAKPGEVVSRYEAPRGENIHYIQSGGGDKPERLKVRAPTLANYPATIEMLRNGFIADIPLIFAAIDPCICCAERTATLTDARTGRERIVRFSDLRRMAAARGPLSERKVEWPL